MIRNRICWVYVRYYQHICLVSVGVFLRLYPHFSSSSVWEYFAFVPILFNCSLVLPHQIWRIPNTFFVLVQTQMHPCICDLLKNGWYNMGCTIWVVTYIIGNSWSFTYHTSRNPVYDRIAHSVNIQIFILVRNRIFNTNQSVLCQHFKQISSSFFIKKSTNVDPRLSKKFCPY